MDWFSYDRDLHHENVYHFMQKILLNSRYNNAELYVVILCLAHSYWIFFCDLVNTYVDELASHIGILAYLNKYHLFSGVGRGGQKGLEPPFKY